MRNPVVVQESIDVAVPQEQAFTGTLPLPLPDLFTKWYGPFPPIKSVDQHSPGPWAAAGQSRTLKMVGPGSVLETLTHVDEPSSFGYTLSDIKGPLALLVDHVEGVWSFTPNAAGSRITWQWTIHPRSTATASLLPTVGRMWRGYARQTLQSLARHLA